MEKFEWNNFAHAIRTQAVYQHMAQTLLAHGIRLSEVGFVEQRFAIEVGAAAIVLLAAGRIDYRLILQKVPGAKGIGQRRIVQ